MGLYEDLVAQVPHGTDYWVNPKQRGSEELLAGLLRYYKPQANVPMGKTYGWAPNTGVVGRALYPQLGVRSFAQQHGVEDLLNWNPKTQQVTLGGIDVPYSFGLQGRTYANTNDLYKILEQVQAAQRVQKQRTPNATSTQRSLPSPLGW